MSRLFYACLFFIIFQSTEAQQKYVDSLFAVGKTQTEVYAEKNNEKLIIDLYFPENNDEKRPLIVFMHGGGFAGGSPKNPQEVKFARMAAARGYAVGLISYRLSRKGQSFGCDYDAEGKMETFQKAATDLMDGFKYLKDHSADLKIDPEITVVGGSSAGAEAVLNAVYNPQLMFKNSENYSEINISAVMSLAGALLDVRYITEDLAIPGIFFHGTKDNLVPYATAPHHYCKTSDPGYLILDGSKTIVERLEQLDTSYLFYSFQDARHEISGMPFEYLPEVFEFLQKVVFDKTKIQSSIYK
ncbi:hypothetical protein GCM10023115_27070 [Pontixanthobacter gangjinensis]|uniref:Alpha/beta hydrolase n=2 Tax=Christiangramia aestuarii TaxID=1028746 RepID=A0A7K1LMH3_9FLAO|nr:alpha/beta hydrolase [Christiangramia aestuarii]